MKTISIDIADNVYNTFKNFLKLLPKESFKIYSDDINELTEEEKKQVNFLKQMTDKKDYTQFDNWQEIEKEL
ncbi:MAG: hypothetical protein KAT68_02985 [Bacteroidales bacterium]|nr:hypothetical protein [Bacteroidales bacterium]